MAIWVVEFSNRGYKIRKILPKNQDTQRKFLNFENWTNGEPGQCPGQSVLVQIGIRAKVAHSQEPQ